MESSECGQRWLSAFMERMPSLQSITIAQVFALLDSVGVTWYEWWGECLNAESVECAVSWSRVPARGGPQRAVRDCAVGDSMQKGPAVACGRWAKMKSGSWKLETGSWKLEARS